MENDIVSLLNNLKECFMAEVWGHDAEMDGYENVVKFINCINQLQSAIESVENDRDYYKLKYAHYLIETGRNKRKEEES